MSKSLTELNKKARNVPNVRLQMFYCPQQRRRFPSCFAKFWIFQRFLVLLMNAALRKRRARHEHEIPPTTAIMAIV
jgi:hypothetical protein